MVASLSVKFVMKKPTFSRLFWPLLGLAVLTFFLYHRTLNAYFIGDDYEWWQLVKNLNFSQSLRLFLPANWDGIVHPEFGYYRPLVAWTIWLNTVPLPMTPLVFHSTSFLFHLANVFLVGFFGYQLWQDYRIAFLASLLFSVLPFHSEAVNYNVGGRYNVVMTTFYLLAILAIFLYQRSKNKAWIPIVWIMFFFSLLSFESAITFPLVALLLLVMGKKHNWPKFFYQHRLIIGGFGFVVLLYSILRTLTLETLPLTFPGYMSTPSFSRAFGIYLLVGLSFIILRQFVKKPLSKIFGQKEIFLWFSYGLIGIFWLPTAYIPTQERHLYLPSVGVVLFLSGLITIWLSKLTKKTTRIYLIILVTLGIGLGSFWLYFKNEQWRLAGNLARKITKQIVNISQTVSVDETIYLVNVPDSIKGAYVYRVREREAVEFELGKTPPKLVFTPKTIGLKTNASITGTKNLSVSSQDGFMFFNPETDEAKQLIIKTPEYQAVQLSQSNLEIEFLNQDFDFQNNQVYYFKDGELFPLPFKKEVN